MECKILDRCNDFSQQFFLLLLHQVVNLHIHSVRGYKQTTFTSPWYQEFTEAQMCKQWQQRNSKQSNSSIPSAATRTVNKGWSARNVWGVMDVVSKLDSTDSPKLHQQQKQLVYFVARSGRISRLQLAKTYLNPLYGGDQVWWSKTVTALLSHAHTSRP